jgi:hypothetical protein
MKQVVCWTDEAVQSITPRDAASLSPSAFQAIHHPLRLLRRPLSSRSGGQWTSELELLAVMRTAVRQDGFLFVPIVGRSGTGKSHLVRWVREQLDPTEGWEVRYLAKNRTTIRGVIEEVIRGLDGPAIQVAREALAEAPGANEHSGILAERLLDELALMISQLPLALDSRHTVQLAQFVDTRSNRVADMLRDPVVRRKLGSEGSVIPRLVGLALTGRTPEDGLDDDAVRVDVSDLPLEFAELATASSGVAKFLGQLKTIPEWLEMTVTIINQVLPTAFRRVFVSSRVDLVNVFRDVRRALFVDGKELALFIEDLTVLHGVEREFLDAIVEPAVQAGEQVMANLRILFAVTDGHFDNLDTVRTRCEDAFWLDAEYDDNGVGREEAANFIGRYLNAARLGPERIATSWMTRIGSAEWIPNACSSCPEIDACHANFGVSSDGHGLYPFNANSLDHFVRVLSPERFDPRRLVSSLGRDFLLHASREIRRDEFPSSELLARFRDKGNSGQILEPVELTNLQAKYPQYWERLEGMIRFWLSESQDGLLSAFALPAIEAQTTQPPASKKAALTGATSQVSDLAAAGPEARLNLSADRRIYDALKEWANGAELPDGSKNGLRKIIHKAVSANLEYGPQPLNLGPDFDKTKIFDQEHHIFFEGSIRQTKSDPLIRIERSPENATALQALLLLDREAVNSFSELSNGDAFCQVVASRIEVWTVRVRSELKTRTTEGIAETLQFLLLSARILHCDEGAKEAPELLNAIFRLKTRADVGASNDRSIKWKEATDAAERLVPAALQAIEVEFGESRGRSGGVRALRAGELLPLIESFNESWTFNPQSTSYSQFSRTLNHAVETEWTSLVGALAKIELHVSLSDGVQQQLLLALEALEKAFEFGRLQRVDRNWLSQRRDMVNKLPTNVDGVLREASRLTAAVVGSNEKLRCCSSDAPVLSAIVSQLVTEFDDYLVAIEIDLETRTRQTGLQRDASTVVNRILAASSKLQENAKALGQ